MKIGIDLGGTKIEIIVLQENSEQLYRYRLPTPKNSYHEILKTIQILINQAEEKVGSCDSVGLGIPGTISKVNNLVKNANTVVLNGQPLKEDLEVLLKRKVNIQNDANCFVVSESTDGAAKNFSHVFGIILGTGVGGGLVINNKLIDGSNSIGGEWGHNPLPWPSKSEIDHHYACFCGQVGCIETFISGTAISKIHENIFSQNKTAIEISKDSLTGDEICVKTMQMFENRLARSLANVINILDPEIIVVGGGLSNIDSLYENIPRIWEEYIFSNDVNTKFVKAMHGDSSGVRGAAWLD
jgi:fructokinase